MLSLNDVILLSLCQQTITCLAAIAWKKNSLSLEKVEVEPPKAGEVRIKVNLNL